MRLSGDEAVPTLLGMMCAKAPYSVIEPTVQTYATVTELVSTMLGEHEPLEQLNSENTRTKKN